MRFLSVLIILYYLPVFSQPLVQIKYSKPFAIIKFLETTKGRHSTSFTFRRQIDSSYISKDSAFVNLKKMYSSLDLDYNYVKPQFPQKRKRTTSTWDLLCISAISSNTNEEFFNKIIGVFPNSDYLKLKQIITEAEPFYDAFIYTAKKDNIADRVRELSGLSPQLNQLFDKFKWFYGSSWDKNIPFNLTIYPIYGMRGETTATPHANSLEMGYLTGEDDNFGLLSIGMHEICHVLFEEQPLYKQQLLDSVFINSKSNYSKFAYQYIDEALATALGNGYAYQFLTDELDSAEWYNNNYINLYAKALYPLVNEYLQNNKQMDNSFVEKAIAIFEQTFPNVMYDIEPMLMSCDIYMENDVNTTIDGYNNLLHQYFRIYNSNLSVPVLDPISLENLKSSNLPQVIILHKNQQQVLAKLKQQFKNLVLLPASKNMVISFLDTKKRAVIIIVGENNAKVKEGIKLLKNQKQIDPKKPWLIF